MEWLSFGLNFLAVLLAVYYGGLIDSRSERRARELRQELDVVLFQCGRLVREVKTLTAQHPHGQGVPNGHPQR